ncbi:MULTISPECIES: CBS domain-containing protein [unclassified Paracoccus (in: a-proteobacteria)]|uniref:CBS domain-containing protein n=1 Tax=unclassified Paracoccus (in: a-proteobacteria) TaxID=2688777 RepID=UPI0012B2CDD3|nr:MULTISPECIES: CBS domain-containing protein [unclassified Paracoccus (in: a-proteobacteria)]UXU74883.1 CBS domain-containing protein [Paracoccus sp. SMMA_5]UXU80784.1 CBS domain-containing protein [Paracoccus sp. SMMA_5_TC]
MLVTQILSMKPNGDIFTIAPGASVAEAAKLLSEKRIGAVVVSEDGKIPLGILSERDIVRELGRRGAPVLDAPISELMTRKPMTCTKGEDALVILERMTQGRFRHLPVVNDAGEMIGLVSIGDAVSARLKELAAEKEALTGMIMGN